METNQVGLVDRGIELAPAKLLTVEDFTYIDKDKVVQRFQPPSLGAVGVTTLDGLVGLLAAGIDGVPLDAVLVHVQSFKTVSVVARDQDKYGVRRVFVAATLLEAEGFPYGRFIDQENFNIGLRSQFVPDMNIVSLLTITGNITKQSEARQEDDGVSQRITVKQGISLVKDTVPPSRVMLAPYRTFREALQPPSDFVFRVKCSDNGNQCALFEADGGYWKIAAMQNVRTWLANALAGTSAELGAIPIIS